MTLVEGASPPVFEQIFRNARFAQGGNALFEGKVRGNPKPQVVWTRKGLQMKGNDKHQMLYDDMNGTVSLLIKTIGPGDEGEYTCTALNPYGEAICTVYISPEATKQVKKSRSGHKLHKSNSNKQVQMMQQQQQQQQQLIQQQQFSSSQQQFSSTQQSSMQQSSMSQMSSMHQQSSSMSMQESSSSMMKSSQQVSSVQSSMKQQSMMSSQQLAYQQTQAIKENEPEVIYLKHVERSAAQQRRDVEESTRYPAPTFMTPLRDMNIVEGEKVHFDAKVAPVGDPSMKVEWFCNGKAIAASSRVNTACQFGFVSLDMLNATTSDTGEYTVLVKNEAGSIQSSARLVVNPRKEIELEFGHSSSLRQVEMSQQQTVRKVIEEELPPRPEFVKPLVASAEKPEGSNIHLEAQVNPVSDHTMKIEWMKDGKAITASSRIGTLFNFGYVSLNINGLRLEDAGTYICRAVNVSGEAFTTTTLRVSATIDLTASTGIAEQETYIKKVQQLEQYQASKSIMTRQESTVEPTQPPEFQTSIKDQLEVREGGFAHFEARLEPMGDHTMKVEWLKDGRPVDASSRITSFFNFGYVALTIKQVALHDNGRYSCVASNRCGRAEVSASLTTISKADADFKSKAWSSIQQLETTKTSTSSQMSFVQQEVSVSPKFVSQLKGTNVILEGQRAHFECRLEPQNDPNMKVEWLHNGQQLKASSRIQTHYDFGYVAIDILDVKKEDAGTYTLVATNLLGTQRTTVDLKVEAHIQLVDQTTIHAKAMEETKRFEMKQESRQEMVIQQEVTSQAKPVFRTPLQDPQPVIEGQNIHLEARLEPIGDPFMRVEWFCNGRPLTIGSRFRTYNDFGFIALDIISVNTSDAGKYVCRATNQLGSGETMAQVNVIAKSNVVTESEHESALEQISYLETSSVQRSHQITSSEEVVVKQPPQFTKMLKNVEVMEGQNVHLEARLSPTGDPTMKVEWTLNGKPLKTGHKIRPAYDFDYVALDLLTIYAEEGGVYTCHARNAYGEAETSASVKVSRAAQVVTESRNEMSQFQYLETKAQVRQEIMEEPSTQAPVFTSSMKGVELKEGQKAHFECRIIPVSDPTLKVQWLHNGTPVKQGSRFREGLDFGFVSLDIMHVYAEDAGTYTCRATNALGQAVNSADLVVKAKETIVKDSIHQAAIEQIQYLEQPRVTQTQEEGFTTQAPVFTCSMRDVQIVEGMPAHFEAKLVPVGDPRLRVEWYKDGRPIQASNRMSTLHDFGFVAFDLKYTRPEDTGNYSCKAFNSIGEAVISANLQVLSAKDGPMADSMHGEALQKIAYLEKKQMNINLAEEDGIQSAPVFVVALQGKTNLIEGQNVHLECRIEPYPDSTLNVEWFRNDKPLPFGNRWRTSYDFGFAALDIIGAYAEDSGRYTLKAKNVLGSSESSIDVKISPRSGLLLDSDHTDALQKIKYLESKHQRTAEEEFAVSEAPQFGHPLKDIVLDEGQPAHFETTLTPVNDATMKVQWLCNGKPVPQGHRFRTTYDFGFVALDILYAYAEDSGTYTCHAANMLGETSTSCSLEVSAKAGLLLDTLDRDRLNQLRSLEMRDRARPTEGDVQMMKPVFTTALNNAEGVPEQSRVHLECRLEPLNDPNLRVEWFVNGKSIKTGHRFRTTHDFGFVSLDILYAYPEDTGTYMCKAVNKLGEAVNTCSVEVSGRKGLLLDSNHPEGWEKMKSMESRGTHRRLELEDLPVGPPHFVTELVGNSIMAEGQMAHFEAQIEPIHDPQLKIEFFHNGKPLKQASRIHTLCDFGYIALDIAQLVESDAGEYKCRAYNKHGEAFSIISLKISGQDVLDTSSQRPEGLEKIRQLESRQTRKTEEEASSFQKPVFTLPIQNLEKEENQNARFAARLIPVGDASLKVEWFKDGKLLSKGTRINTVHDFGCVSLDITGLRTSDEGLYECKATNSLGEASTAASCRVLAKGSLILDSQHPEGMRKITELERARASHKQVSDEQQAFDKPVFVTPLTGTSVVAEGQQAHMECRVVPLGDASMNVNWFKNGEALQMGSRFHVTQDFGFVTLDIASCVAEDSGMYMVKAVNLSGEASSSFAVHVGGRSGVLGEALHPDSYKKIQALEAGKSAKRQVSDDAVIAQPPVFMEQLKEVGVVAEGQNIFLEARIEPKNDSNLKVEWELNGKSVKTGSRLRTTLDFGHVTLHLNDVRASDSGIYTCKAINLLGEAVSTTSIKVEEGADVIPATAKETGPPKFVTSFLESYSISEGQSCHMEARLTPVDDPNMKVEWFKDGKPLPTGHRFRTFHDFGIVILDILYCFAEDTGVYECRATNKLGSDSIKCSVSCSEKSGLILTPQVPGEMKAHTMERIQHLESMRMRTQTQSSVTTTTAPRFTVPITNIENMKEGENAHFEARLVPTDDPTLTVEWFWNGKALKAGSRIRTFCDFGFVILEISPVYPEDAGEYMCRAKNALGEAVTTATLKCSGKRNIIMDSQLPKGMEGAIDKIASLEGLGRFRATDNISEDIDQPPEFLSNLEDLLLAENSLAHFETRLMPINDPSMRVEWYHNGKNLSAGSRIKTINDFGFVILEVANVLTRDSGNYTCKATNRHGEASISCNVVVKSRQDIITDPQLPKSFRSGTESIQRLEEHRWRREEMVEDTLEAKPPKFITSIKDVQVIEGQPAHFDCRVEPIGDGSMRIEWYHDGQPIQIGSRIHTISDFGFVVLDIDWTFKRDSGTYICRATNRCGTAEAKANLICKSKKDINLDSQLPEGMSLDKLKELEKGKRQDRTEEVEAEITAPKFITQLKSRAVGEGEPAHFNCRVEPKHDPKLQIKWFHNDHELASGHRFRITHEFGYVALDILYTYPEDDGEYVCKATNALGEDITRCELKCKELPAIQLENQVPKGMKKSEYLVQMEAAMKKYTQEIFLTEDDVYDGEKRQPPRFVTQIQSVTDLVEMQATKFECQLAPVGDPYMKVEWFFNGKALPYKNRFTPIYDFGYVAMNFSWVYPEDSGEYVCRASNLYGMDETRGILKTSGKPGIVYESQLPKGMASIERIREMESGWQRAPELIENEAERFKPCFVTKPEAQIVQEGDSARFCCRVTGYPKPRVMWLLNGHTVINGSKHKLIYDGMWHFDIPKCRDLDAGKVEVIARNQCGEAYSTTTLEVSPRQDDYRSVLRHNVKRDYINSKEYRKPEWLTRMEEIQKRLAEQQHSAKITQELREIRIKEGLKAKFEASFAGNPKPDVIWQLNGVEIVTSDRVRIKIRDTKTTLTIHDVVNADAGQYTVRVKNDLGSDLTRAGLTISKLGEDVPKPKPEAKPAEKPKKVEPMVQLKPAFKRAEKKPEPKPEPKQPEPFQLKKATPRAAPKPAEEKPAPGIEIKLRKTAPVHVEKPKEDKLEIPSLKRVEPKVVEKAEEHVEGHHLKHVVKHVEEEEHKKPTRKITPITQQPLKATKIKKQAKPDTQPHPKTQEDIKDQETIVSEQETTDIERESETVPLEREEEIVSSKIKKISLSVKAEPAEKGLAAVSEATVSEMSFIERPTAQETVLPKPAVKESTVEKPAVVKPAVVKPAVVNLKEAEPAVVKPEVAEPAVEKPIIEKPEVPKPAVVKPEVSKPAVEQLAVSKPKMEKAEVVKPAEEKPALVKPAVAEPEVEKPAVTKPAIEKPEAAKPFVEKLTLKKPTVTKLDVEKPAVEETALVKPAVKEPAMEKPEMVKAAVKETIVETPTVVQPSPVEKLKEAVGKPTPAKVVREKEEPIKLRKSTSKEIKEQPTHIVEPVFVEEEKSKPKELIEKVKPVEKAKPAGKAKAVEEAKPIQEAKPTEKPTPSDKVTEIKPAVTPKVEPERKVSEIGKVEEKMKEPEEQTPKLKPVLKKTPRTEEEIPTVQKIKPVEPTVTVEETPDEKVKEISTKHITPFKEPKVAETTAELEQEMPTGQFIKEVSPEEIEQAEEKLFEGLKREEESSKVEKSVSFTLSPKEMSPTPSEEHEPNLVKKKKKKKKEKVSPTKETTLAAEAEKEAMSALEIETTEGAEAKEMSPEPLIEKTVVTADITDIAHKLDTKTEQIETAKVTTEPDQKVKEAKEEQQVEVKVKKAPKPEAEPKPKKVAPKTEAPGPKEIPAMPVAESKPVEPLEPSSEVTFEEVDSAAAVQEQEVEQEQEAEEYVVEQPVEEEAAIPDLEPHIEITEEPEIAPHEAPAKPAMAEEKAAPSKPAEKPKPKQLPKPEAAKPAEKLELKPVPRAAKPAETKEVETVKLKHRKPEQVEETPKPEPTRVAEAPKATEEVPKPKEKPKVKKAQQAIPKLKPELPKTEIAEPQQAYEEPMKELANIGARLERGVSVTELNAAYQANEFPALKRKKSQIAILKAVERVGESAVVQQVLAQEYPETRDTDEAQVSHYEDAGFQALLTTLANESHKIEEIITQVQPEDFTDQVVEERFAKIVHDSHELVAAPQATEMTTEVRQQIDAELKKAGISEVRSEMVVASAQQTEMRVSSVQKAETAVQEPVLDIKEGDVFYALATFVSETGEAMNLVEGERVFVLEWNNQDWWYVRKHLTEESGWVPAQYLKDEQTYTMYVQKKLVEKIEKLPVFDKPKEGDATFAPKIIDGVHSVSAPDGSQVEFVCKVEGNPRPQITWFRQTAIIKPSQDFQIFYYDDNKATLVIKEVFPEDAGTFTCVAKNCVGFASSSAELSVQHPLSEHGLEKHDRRSISRESSLADIVEGIPPTFAQRPQTKTAEEGGHTELECRFVAIPEADVQWYHNKVELKESKRVVIQHQADMHMYCSIIKITDIKKEDAGTYEVTARNREGEATNTLVLNVTPKAEIKAPVKSAPIIVKPLTPTVCKVGEAVKLEAVITGTPKPSLEWSQAGKPLSLGDNLKIVEKDNIYTLSIDHVTQSMEGEYTILATNSSGSVHTSAYLSVQETIEFVETLEDVEIKERNTIEMQVEVSAEESKVKWYKDGEILNEQDQHYEFKSAGRKHSIVIKNATVHHEGEYVASVGEQECSCELTVIELPPEFTKKIEPLTVTAGEEKAIFEIELSKGDAITKWFKNGKEVELSDRVHLKIDGKKQRLEIYNVEISDAGEFSCTIGNEKCAAPLVVEEPKVNFVAKLPATTTGTVGQDVRITVTLTNASASAKWLKDGTAVSESSKYSFEVEGASKTIVIKAAAIEDVGKYTCLAENVRTETELELKGAEETIEVVSEQLEKEQVAIKGQEMTYTINFKKSYLEKPKVQWLFNSKTIVTSERIVTTVTRKSASISIKQVENIDCGTYVAKISNSSSEVSVEFKLSIKDKPSSPRGPASVEWKSDGSMELLWNIPETDGGAVISQYIVERREVGKKSWKQVGTSEHTCMEIRGLKKDSSYNFRVIAKNNVGCSAPFIIEETFTAATGVKPVPKGVPSAPNNVQVTDVTSRSVTLQWSPPFNTGGVELTGYIIEKRLATTHKWERLATVDTSVTLHTIENLKEKSQYYFRVSAENEIGAGETAATEKVSLQTHARPPSSPTAPLEITALGPHSVMVEWGAPESDGGAPLEGYKVAVRDAKRHMWMEVGRVAADVQKLKVQELAETHEYFIRIYAKNEVGFSEPLENEEPFKVIRPADYNEEEAEAERKHDDTPSLSFSTTETLSSWMREANMDADIQSYTKSSILRRDEYFFRIWYYASKLFK